MVISTLAINLVESLPMMPLVSQVIKSFADSEEDFDLPAFVESIQYEPTVSAKLLGYANSAANRAGREVISVQDAVIRLGLVQTKSIVLALVVNSQFDTKRCPAFLPNVFWLNTMMKARFVRCILPFTPHYVRLEVGQVYSLSLIADLGLLLLVSQYPDELNNILNDDAEVSVSSRIRNLFAGHDHYYFSGLLLDHWGLPDSYVETITHLGDVAYNGPFLDQVSLLRMSHHMLKQADHNDIATNEMVAFGIALNQSKIDQIVDCVNRQKKFIQSMSDHMVS